MSAPLEIFCCYAREDQEMLAHLKKHLIPLQKQGQITIWSDTNLNAGVEWEKELHRHLDSANIILLLVSPDFMASDYCYSTEMGRAIARHNEGSAVVIPILLRPTFWQNMPFAKLQIVPTNAKPVTSWSDRDDAMHDITIYINQVIVDLSATGQQRKGGVPMEKTKEQWIEEAENYDKAEQSIEAYSKAIELDPDDAEVYRSRGYAYESLKRYGKAIDDYDQAILLEPYSPMFYIYRGDAYCEVKKYQKGIADYDEAIELTDSSSDLEYLYEKRGDAYFSLQDHDKAHADYEECLDIARRNFHTNWPVTKKLTGLNLYQLGKEKGYL